MKAVNKISAGHGEIHARRKHLLIPQRAPEPRNAITAVCLSVCHEDCVTATKLIFIKLDRELEESKNLGWLKTGIVLVSAVVASLILNSEINT